MFPAFRFRRWRIAILTILFMVVSLYYLNAQRNQPNYGNSPYVPPSPHNPFFDGRVHWKKRPDQYPVLSLIPLPSGSPKKIPKIQAIAPTESDSAKEERLRRRDAVKESFTHSWEGYKK